MGIRRDKTDVFGTDVKCMPFSDAAGQLTGTVLAALSLVVYIGAFAVNKWIASHQGPDERFDEVGAKRPWKVFYLDLAKIAISQSAAWVVNLFFTAYGSEAVLDALDKSGSSVQLQGVAVFAVIFVLDAAIGVPLGILFSSKWTQWCRRHAVLHIATAAEDDDEATDFALLRVNPHRRLGSAVGEDDEENPFAPVNNCCEWQSFVVMNCEYGRYGVYHTPHSHDDIRCSWWLAQLCSWSFLVAVSRTVSGVVIPLSLYWRRDETNPFIELAAWATRWDISCATKQILVVGVWRLIIDLIQIAIIDWWNRMRGQRRHDDGVVAPLKSSLRRHSQYGS